MTGEDGSQPSLKHVGPYELLRPIAQGGMADIFLARKAGDGREVAIKILNRLRATEPESCAMFLDEARLVGMLDHPNIAAVLEANVAEGHHYLAMEYVRGADLRELLATAAKAGRSIPYEVSLAIIAAAAAGLDHAHRRCDPGGRPLRLVHRDVSLSNLMVSHDGAVKVVDFGIASTAVQTVHTSPGVVRGKASYMAPEQCLGDPVDHRTDIFALGVVLYELTTGARCFAGKTDFERMLAVVRGEYHAPTAIVANYPPELEQVVRTALAADPAQRYSSCHALIEALERVAHGRGWKLGPAPIARLMRRLYEPATEPVLVIIDGAATQPMVAWDPDPTVCDAVPPHDAAPTERSRRRLAQGTNAEGYVPPAGEPTDDDQPTRGRRPLPRRPSSPNLAA